MSSLNIALLSTPSAHALLCLLCGVTLLHFHRRYGKRYLLLWAASWLSLSLFHAANGASVALSSSGLGSPNVRAAVSFAAVLGGSLQTGWLPWGCFEIAKRRPFRMRDSRILLVVAAGVAVAAWLILFSMPENMKLTWFGQVGIHSFIAATVLLFCAYLMSERAMGGSIGFFLLAFGFAALALLELHHFLVRVLWLAGRTELSSGDYFGAFAFALEAAVALAMFVCFLDDEREAALRAASQVEHLAYHDPLTGLPNRGLFMDRLAHALTQASRHRYKLAVLFVDLDRFKEINDSLGHSAGDALLRTASRRIRECVRSADTVARFGGDEFVIILHIIGRVEDAGRVAQKVIEALRDPFDINGHELVVTSSVGVAIYPIDGEDAERLVRNADTAMYRAKQQGRDGYQLYTAAMNSRALEKLELENRLRKALRNRELTLFYQPLVDVQKGRVVGLEALLRWQHPELGLLLPEKFIPTAELSGLIVPIGHWVLREACKQAKEWHRRGLDLVVSVNLSPRQFQQPDLTGQVRAALQENNLEGHYLELEITEGSAMQDIESSIRILRDLKSLGVRISIDDFGTGYSSLSYLKNFPVDTLKLDQSFVRDITRPQDAAIASGIISMAHNLDLNVVAEGVETEKQADVLRSNSCDRLQGYLFSVPLSAEAFDQYVTTNRGLQLAQ
jgi:diguanylate cyclase (GGDEF)-like protein